MIDCGVYSITLADGRCYVGSSSNVKARWKAHRRLLDAGTHHSPHLQNAWKKYGADAFVWAVIQQCEKSALIEREQYWIDRTGGHFNVARAAGSRLGVPQSPETIEKVRKAHLGRKRSDETKAKISAGNIGRHGPLGCKRSDEHKAAISAAQKARVRPAGVHLPAEIKAKISAAQKGRPRPYAARERRPEEIEAMRAAALANSENRRRAALVRWANARAEKEQPCQ
ncbi:MAG: GIY-YIG nuclease family protein [Betaproteobacteria bacterium]|nr:GIY-YIG nuclease family protein [Betaproteobacteria bacterium]